jgi:hypothetical protein
MIANDTAPGARCAVQRQITADNPKNLENFPSKGTIKAQTVAIELYTRSE